MGFLHTSAQTLARPFVRFVAIMRRRAEHRQGAGRHTLVAWFETPPFDACVT
jgi:hypothetical protein